MSVCETIEIVTPKKVLLNGLWFGPAKPKRVIIWVHGLGSSAFSKLGIADALIDKNIAVITFNNRGHDKVSRIARTGEKKISKAVLGGSAHEVFTDCVDDIQGAINFVKRAGVKNIYLAGHSTGCQKSIYWASKRGRLPARGAQAGSVKGIILLAPISDYSAEMHLKGKGKIARAAEAARALVSRGKKHQLLDEKYWPYTIDAQRFLSLYTPDSVEEIFTYAQPTKNPRTLKSVTMPLLVLLAEKDEYGDRPAKKIAEWFLKNGRGNLQTLIVPRTTHSFHGKEKTVASVIKRWVKKI
ncbi:MAG: alpha/beta fold hydrolase [bacterium]|nr:alpha/beta fold hydrolase [bacterium]